jgi:hypothetical protein
MAAVCGGRRRQVLGFVGWGSRVARRDKDRGEWLRASVGFFGFRISASTVVACVLCGMGENTPREWAYGSPAIP